MEVKFGEWVKFTERKDKFDKKDLKSPGIYAIAFDSAGKISGKEFNFAKEIVYFGMTNSQGGLKSRLQQFDYTLKNEKSLHGGASRLKFYYKKYKPEVLIKKLYFSIWSFTECHVEKYNNGCIETDDKKIDDKKEVIKTLELMGEVAMAEYLCFAKYVELYNSMPKFNNKEKYKKE